MKKREEIEIIPGQLSIFDLMNIKAAEEVTEPVKKVTKEAITYTKIDTSVTEKQQKIIDKYKKEKSTRRIIRYCGKGLGIEVETDQGIQTIYFNREGKKEFVMNKASPVLPMDKILYHAVDLDNSILSRQLDAAEEVKKSFKVKRVIHRRGDYNLLIEHDEGVISINQSLWKLEFNSIKEIDCEEDEVLESITNDSVPEELEDIGEGDTVEIKIKEERFIAEVYRIYNNGETMSIFFDNGKKHTAVHRSCIVRKVC